MTLLAPAPITRPAAMTLTEAEPGFWVASTSGAFAGTVDHHGDHFYVRDCFSQYLGDYNDLATAAARLRTDASVRNAA
ncbi:hypothetical protein IFT77_16290 [Frigoribacterium sp. CFBP 13729]|uniref:hypothetical protein n=1 Tax=unclassified Frigoribacterium TaxID=2627005 RepID=UPI0017839032|nr:MULTISPECIES: hypothetical protein [unclassified Frigoribacterium]MBD8586136.1 hypothetical protein [Frigoribacterium sp. CFBP 8766]MBD8612052.1 hypothetical protein [Frigoribacterium sp. CFBP 13729]MBP1189832.1 hypothetical protein [Frigoribacterium sp. PvP032]